MKFYIPLYLVTILLLVFQNSFAQQASDYFPSQTGYVWKYSEVPLDSLNNPVDTLSYRRVDSFAVMSNYNGMPANIILSKTGPQGLINNLPYSDSLFYNFSADTAYEYEQVGQLAELLIALDSVLADTTFSFLSFLKSLEEWYPVYRFSSPVGDGYTIFSVDTSITFGTTNLPLRFEYLAKRLQDETINTQIGTFNCKKFFVERGVSYLIILPPPIPPVQIRVAYIGDTLWLAPDNWMVKSFIPSTSINLQFVGGPAFYIPGLSTEILDEPVLADGRVEIPQGFELEQNYPNPFNPETKIYFNLNETGFVDLKIYNLLGEEIETLVSKEMNTGKYEFKFDGRGLPSGMYLYRAVVNYQQTGKPGISITKKMMLLK